MVQCTVEVIEDEVFIPVSHIIPPKQDTATIMSTYRLLIFIGTYKVYNLQV